MFRFHRVISQVGEDVVDLLVLLHEIRVHLINLVTSHPVGEFAQLILFDVKGVFDCLVHINLERCLVNFFNRLPNFANGLPHLHQVGVVLF